MKTIRLFPLEFGRLLQNRLTWLIVLLTVISPAAGLFLYKPATATTMLSLYLANPAIAGGVVGGILFGLLTIFELDRVSRSRADILMDAAVSPLTMALVRLLALLAAAGRNCGPYNAGLAPHQYAPHWFSIWRPGLCAGLSAFDGAGPAAVHSGRCSRLSVYTEG